MQFILVLYPLYDLDIISFKLDKTLNFGKLIQKSLEAYVRGEVFNIASPSNIDWNEYNYKPIRCFITLDDNEEIQDLFRNVKKRYKNSLVKTIFRKYISETSIKGYYVGLETPFYVNNKALEKEQVDISKPSKALDITNKKNENKKGLLNRGNKSMSLSLKKDKLISSEGNIFPPAIKEEEIKKEFEKEIEAGIKKELEEETIGSSNEGNNLHCEDEDDLLFSSFENMFK